MHFSSGGDARASGAAGGRGPARARTSGSYAAWMSRLAESEVELNEMPSGRRARSSKRVTPSNATFSVMMLMSG